MPTAHMIHGFVGAGKTTFSKKLQAELKAVRFTPDEWMIALHGTNPPADKFQEYEEKVKDLIWIMIDQVLRADVDVILDFGFWKKEYRNSVREKIKTLDAEVKLYNLQCSESVVVQRVLKRTKDMPEGALYIDKEAIDIFKTRFEPVDPTSEDSILINTEN